MSLSDDGKPAAPQATDGASVEKEAETENKTPAPATTDLPQNPYPPIVLQYYDTEGKVHPVKTPVYDAKGSAEQSILDRVCESGTTNSVETLAHILLFGQNIYPKDESAGLQLLEQVEKRGRFLMAALLRATHQLSIRNKENDEKENFDTLVKDVLKHHKDPENRENNFYCATFLLRVPGKASRKLAIKYMRRSADQGYGPALLCVAESYYNGRHGEKLTKEDLEEAGNCLARAHAAGQKTATLYLGIFHARGIYGFPLEEDIAENYFMQLTEGESSSLTTMDEHGCRAQAYFYLGELCEARKEDNALQYFQKAADLGVSQAVMKLSIAHFFGALGLKKNLQEAVLHLQRALALGNPEAMSIFGNLAKEGDSSPNALARAMESLRSSGASPPQMEKDPNNASERPKKPTKAQKKRAARRKQKKST